MTRLEKARAEAERCRQAYESAVSRKDHRAQHHTWIAFRDARVAEIMEERSPQPRPWLKAVFSRLAACFREQPSSAGFGSR